MKLTEGAVGFHLGNDGVDKDEEIVLPLAHQHTDFSVGERVLDKRCSEAWVMNPSAPFCHSLHLIVTLCQPSPQSDEIEAP